MPRVLVVDDDADIRFMLRSVFDSRGWSVDEATGGEDGLALFRSQGYDAIVLDHKMPGLTGYDVAAQLRGEDFDGPIIFYSAYVTPELEGRLWTEVNRELFVIAKTDFPRLIEVVDRLSSN